MKHLGNILLHAVHLTLIGICLVAWAFPATRDLHLITCCVILASWFLIGPLIGQPGFCLVTGLQHWLWGKQGREERPNYMSYLFERITGHSPGERGIRVIDNMTQATLYLLTALSIYVR